MRKTRKERVVLAFFYTKNAWKCILWINCNLQLNVYSIKLHVILLGILCYIPGYSSEHWQKELCGRGKKTLHTSTQCIEKWHRWWKTYTQYLNINFDLYVLKLLISFYFRSSGDNKEVIVCQRKSVLLWKRGTT